MFTFFVIQFRGIRFFGFQFHDINFFTLFGFQNFNLLKSNSSWNIVNGSDMTLCLWRDLNVVNLKTLIFFIVESRVSNSQPTCWIYQSWSDCDVVPIFSTKQLIYTWLIITVCIGHCLRWTRHHENKTRTFSCKVYKISSRQSYKLHLQESSSLSCYLSYNCTSYNRVACLLIRKEKKY